MAREPGTEFEANLRIKVRLDQVAISSGSSGFAPQKFESQLSPTKTTADVDAIAGAGAGTSNGEVLSDCAQHGNADRDDWKLSRVTARQAEVSSRAARAMPRRKLSSQAARPAGGQGKRQKEEAG